MFIFKITLLYRDNFDKSYSLRYLSCKELNLLTSIEWPLRNVDVFEFYSYSVQLTFCNGYSNYIFFFLILQNVKLTPVCDSYMLILFEYLIGKHLKLSCLSGSNFFIMKGLVHKMNSETLFWFFFLTLYWLLIYQNRTNR